MNAPLRFDFSISPEKLARALAAGLDENRPLKWWTQVAFLDHGSRLIQHEDFKCIARDGMIRVTVKELHYHIIRESLQRAFQLLADFYPRSLGELLDENFASGAADKFVQLALFGEVRFV